MDSHRQSTVYNRYATLIFTNPVFLGFSRYQNVKFGSQRDNFSHTEKSRKAHFTRVTEVVGSCQMCWNFNGMQHICNKYATNISMICTGHFQSNLGMSFLRVTTSGAADSEYIEMMLASIEIYLLDDIARQRNMSKIALQSANDTD